MPPVALSLIAGASLFGGLLGSGKNVECPPQRQQWVTLLRAEADGDIALLVARITERLSTEDVACWAATGDKPMMLELAKRLEAGDGIALDRERAEDLYREAARTISGTIYAYSPRVGKSPGQVIPIRTRPDVPGLPEARFRLALMHVEGRAPKPRLRRGFKWLHALAKEGYPPAIAYLARAPKT